MYPVPLSLSLVVSAFSFPLHNFFETWGPAPKQCLNSDDSRFGPVLKNYYLQRVPVDNAACSAEKCRISTGTVLDVILPTFISLFSRSFSLSNVLQFPSSRAS